MVFSETTIKKETTKLFIILPQELFYVQGCLGKMWNYVTRFSDKLVLGAVGLCALEVNDSHYTVNCPLSQAKLMIKNTLY